MAANKQHMQKLNIWVVYYNAKDYPGQYASRLFHSDKSTDQHFVDDKLSKVHQWIQSQGQANGVVPVRMPRDPRDEPHIVECWL